jgi:hypothetical protein
MNSSEARGSPAWLRAAFAGAVICGVVGPGFPLLVLIPASALKDASSFEALKTLEAFPVARLFALIPMGPPGALLGALGASWIQFRSRRLASSRLLWEAESVGTLLGAVVPITTLAFGWGPLDVLLGYVRIGGVMGAVCAFLVVYILRRRGLLFCRATG